MQVGVMRVGWFAPSVEPTVGNVAMSVGADLGDTEIDVIAICRGRGCNTKTGLFFRLRVDAGGKFLLVRRSRIFKRAG